MNNWWQIDITQISENLKTDSVKGLSSEEVNLRLEKYGANQLKEAPGRNPFKIFFDQFNNLIVWILIAAAVVSGFLKEWVDSLAIISIVIVNAILGFIQEYRAEKSLTALKKLSSPHAKVIRNGEYSVIAATELVPGDLIELEAGDHIPADSRICWLTANFGVQEASLTGESTPVHKTYLPLKQGEIPLAERSNMIYTGTSVVSGKARALIVETGMQTELGKIAGMIQVITHETTPLQKKLEEFGKWLVYICLGLVALVFLLGLLRGGNLLEMFLTSVSLAVAAIPEGLAAVVTIALALGVQRMVKRNALIRKLPSVETLGCATVICSDKTGTLTKNEMTVQAIFVPHTSYQVTGIGYAPAGDFLLDETKIDPSDHPDLKNVLTYGALCNGAQLIQKEEKYQIVGDPTEGAILTAAAKMQLEKNRLEHDFPFIAEIPFDSERKKMTIIRRHNNRLMAFVKGAPDVLLNDCISLEKNNTPEPLTEENKKKILDANHALSNQAMRVLAVAYRFLDKNQEDYEADIIEEKLTFVGLIAMIDPPRLEVKEAMKKCMTAGIRTVMITGDHKNTAVAIAKELGFYHKDSLALTGEELDQLTDDELLAKVEHIPVYARVAPEHKLRIVKAWRKRGHVVAMTGDGVNDAPAVKEADIGVAMGITGTDVTKEVSDMVITDDNFASIVSAVEEGRGIYDNIQKFIHYLLSCNAGEILVMFVASLIGWPIPLLPIHILWVNLVTDGLPALALGVDPTAKDIMNRSPRNPQEKVITKDRARQILSQGSFIAFCSLLAFCFVLFIENEGIGRGRTAAFIVLACAQLFHALNCRNQNESIFKIGFFSNPKLIGAICISFLLQMAVVYVPFLSKIFKTEPLGVFDWIMVVCVSSFPLWAMETVKALKRRKNLPSAV